MNLLELSGRKKDKLIQFALNLEDVKQDKLKFPMLWSQKIDGVFCAAHKTREGVTIYSRTGEIYTSMKHIEDELSKVMYTGDIIMFEAHSYKTSEQSKISGWARDTKAQHPELHAACHTFLYEDDFKNKNVIPYAEGFRILQNLLEGTDKRITPVLAQQYVQSIDEAMKLTELIWIHGGEGGVLRNPNAFYQGGKRNQDIIKLKKGVSYDLEVVGVYEGKGKYNGNLGGLVCKWKDGETINISGMTDSQRCHWWAFPYEIIGRIVQVDAMCESSKGLLREPRFKGIRYDKTKGDF